MFENHRVGRTAILSRWLLLGLVALSAGCQSQAPPAGPSAAADPLASWNEGATKRAIVDFVQLVTTPGGPSFVPVPERIAVFDNDGTLWAEQPMYFQLAFALDRVKALAPQHPEWRTSSRSRAVLAGDIEGRPRRRRARGPRDHRGRHTPA